MPSESDKEAHQQDSISNHKKSFNPGDFVFDHIGDAHDWHILTIGEHHITIPLPVILFSRHQKRLHVFWSSKFHHGHSDYENFRLVQEGALKGKIVELNPSGEPLEKLPLDFSIKKNVAAIFFSMLLLCFIFISVARSYKKRPKSAPKGLQNLMEMLILFVRDDIVIPSLGQKHYAKYMPFLLTIFFFIWINNLLGLIPIFPAGANVTGNIAVTMVLAIFSFFTINLNANKQYWKHIFNPPGIPMFLKLPVPLMPFVELLGIFIKPFVLMVRLFANILAGHIVAMVLFSLIFIFGSINVYFGYGISLVSILLTVFMSVLELLVALIQAYVFTLLTALFIGMATEEHH
ncbi:MAG TPA: F0F1 ATP synthase subunit A [Tenuifilaceae bacterium]|nr:F0F1 ATP synthase subunit A [Tenuifilaceae bacterium]